MGRTDDVKALPPSNGPTHPTKARQKRGRQKTVELRPQVITFSCIFCSHAFANIDVLFDHMRRVHPNLCEIPQITASEIKQEISEAEPKKAKEDPTIPDKQSLRGTRTIEPPPPPPPSSTIADQLDQYLSEDENSVDHLIEMVETDEEMRCEDEEEVEEEEEEEEIESPPYDSISLEEPANNVMERQEINPTAEDDEAAPPLVDPTDYEDLDDDDDDEEYLSLMEPICELRNCNDSETEEFQNKLLESIKSTKLVNAKPGRGRRRDYTEDIVEAEGAGEGFFQCTVCNKSFTYAGELARHVRSHTLNKPYACSICDKSFTHIGSLNTHLRIHSGVKPYKCHQCDKAFTQSSSLMVHLRSHLTLKPHQCPICEKGFMNAISLQLHLKSHKADDLLQCPKCDKKFKQATLLTEHLMIHTEQPLYQCSICRLQFPTGSDLVQHLKCHTGEKPFQCSECGKSFTQPGSLSTHTRIHTGEKPFQCSECDKCFTQASSLSVHMKIHSAEKPFWCHICQRSYSQQAYFNKHMTYHQQDRFAQCPLCNAVVFDAGKQLVKHFNKVHYDKQDKCFLCSICAAKYEDPQLLIQHVKIHFEPQPITTTAGGENVAKL